MDVLAMHWTVQAGLDAVAIRGLPDGACLARNLSTGAMMPGADRAGDGPSLRSATGSQVCHSCDECHTHGTARQGEGLRGRDRRPGLLFWLGVPDCLALPGLCTASGRVGDAEHIDLPRRITPSVLVQIIHVVGRFGRRPAAGAGAVANVVEPILKPCPVR